VTFDDLRPGQFISLTTYRRDGTPVATTVWFAHHGGGIVVGTGSGSGKAKRIRRDPRVTIAAANYRGKLKSDRSFEATARILDGAEKEAAHDALAAKYGLQWGILGRKIDAFLAIVPTPDDAGG